MLWSLGLPRPLWRRRGVCLALCGVAAGLVSPAVAARPAPGGHYYGFPAAGQYRADGLSDVTADLRVSRNGRGVAAVTLLLSCDSRRSRYDVKMVEMKLAFGRASGATIRRNGSFALAGGDGERRYRLSGRFLTADYARLVYRASMPPPRPVDRRRFERCRSGRASAVLYRNGEPPFSGCRSQRAATLLLTSTGRVLQQYALTKPRGGFFPHAYGCLFATPKRRVDLGQNYDDETVEVPRLAGQLVAYAAGECAIGGCFAQLEIRDLRDGSVVRTLYATPGPPDGPNRVHDLVLTGTGALAWTVSRGAFVVEPFDPQQVWALDTQGQRLLDGGSAIDLQSLSLNGSALTWIKGGVVRSATLD